MRARFKDKSMQEIYETCRRLAAEAHGGNIEKLLSAVDKAMPAINDRVLPK
jgi:hypothetical protein